MRRPIIAGNWKMNKGPISAVELAKGVRRGVADVHGVDAVLAPPFVSLSAVSDAIEGSAVRLSGQNLHWESAGAYTGEISAPMLKELGCTFVIIGHSERRQLFGETDETVNLKVKAALAHGILPIVCVGESLEEREAGSTMKVVETQLNGGLQGVETSDVESLVLAYEPIWAIGTGRTASPKQAQEVHAFLRSRLEAMFSERAARNVRIQYGGSVKPANVEELMAQPDIDGALVGGASLTAESFSELVRLSAIAG